MIFGLDFAYFISRRSWLDLNIYLANFSLLFEANQSRKFNLSQKTHLNGRFEMKKSALSRKFLIITITLAIHAETGSSHNQNQYGRYDRELGTRRQPISLNGFEFNSHAKKDLKRLSAAAVMKGTRLIESHILTGKIAGLTKVRIPNKYKFEHFHTSDGTYIIAWEIIDNQVVVLAIRPHENFYTIFRRRYNIHNKLK